MIDLQRRLITLPGGLTLEVALRGPTDGLPVLMLHGITDSWHSFEQSLLVPAHVWREAFAGLLKDDFSGGLAGVRAPVHLVHGERDAFVPRADFDRLRLTLPNASAEAWPDAGHAMHWEQPGRFARALLAFAKSLPQPQSAVPA